MLSLLSEKSLGTVDVSIASRVAYHRTLTPKVKALTCAYHHTQTQTVKGLSERGEANATCKGALGTWHLAQN